MREVVVICCDGYMYSGKVVDMTEVEGFIHTFVEDESPDWREVPSLQVFEVDKPLPINHPTVKQEIEMVHVY